MKMIYLASPYSPQKGESNSIRFDRYVSVTKAAALLTKKYGFAMFLPITQSHNLQRYVDFDHDFDQWAAIDLYAISKSDEVWVLKLKGWRTSKGVMAEIKFAKSRNIPVKYLSKSLRFVKG